MKETITITSALLGCVAVPSALALGMVTLTDTDMSHPDGTPLTMTETIGVSVLGGGLFGSAGTAGFLVTGNLAKAVMGKDEEDVLE